MGGGDGGVANTDSPYGDVDVLRRRVDQLREQATDVRTLADQVVGRTEAVGWTGRAADTLRQRVTARAADLRAAAERHETAADSLEKHLVVVERVQEQIATVERSATDLVAEARTRVARAREAADADSGVRVEPDPDDLTLAGFEAPARGHRDWLDVDLPGLRGADQ
jgi:hypothetical protein